MANCSPHSKSQGDLLYIWCGVQSGSTLDIQPRVPSVYPFGVRCKLLSTLLVMRCRFPTQPGLMVLWCHLVVLLGGAMSSLCTHSFAPTRVDSAALQCEMSGTGPARSEAWSYPVHKRLLCLHTLPLTLWKWYAGRATSPSSPIWVNIVAGYTCRS